MQFPDHPLLIIIGPTAVGKTEIAIQVARHLNAEIVSADSRLFYRGMDIGTAKPTLAERQGIPHHLIDVAEPDEVWSLAVFQEAARHIIAEIQSRNRLPILIGGTGQYVRSVTEGWILPPQKPEPHLRHAIENIAEIIGAEELHRRLAIIDPEAAANIEPGNLRRTVRALEVIFNTGHRFSIQRRRSLSHYSILQIGLIRPRPELYARIDARITAMLENGFLDEVRDLLQRGFSADLPTLSAIGYREMIAHLKGEMSLDEAIVQMKKLTRQFVRRQTNWFKPNDPTIHWFNMNDSIVDQIICFIQSGEGWIIPKSQALGDSPAQTD